jgi:hypothetical protein
MAKAALAKNDLHFFDQRVNFIFGKSYVQSSVTGDLFEGVSSDGIAYRQPAAFSASKLTSPVIELGGPWHFYRDFWRAHGLDNLTNLLGPEIMAQRASRFTFPVRIENPTGLAVSANLSVDLPEGWSLVTQMPTNVSVEPHDHQTVMVTAKTPETEVKGWKTIRIAARSGSTSLGQIRIRVELDLAAMPE